MRATMTLLVACLLGIPTGGPRAASLDYCAAAGGSAPSESRRVDQLHVAVADAARALESSLELFAAAEAAVLAASPPTTSGRWDPERLDRRLYELTVGHWLSVKKALCECLSAAERESHSCARWREQKARACALAPERRGIDVGCLVKGR